MSPTSLSEADADRAHRHVVRLTRVEFGQDPSGGLFEDPPQNGPAPITLIEWDPADALPFALCISVPRTAQASASRWATSCSPNTARHCR